MGKIVWLASYPKSGNTWMRAFLHNLMRDPPEGYDINRMGEFSLSDSTAFWYRAALKDKDPETWTREDVAGARNLAQQIMTQATPDNVFVKTHNALVNYLGKPLICPEWTAGAIYIVRNPLDVVISLADHYGQTIDETIKNMADPGNITIANKDIVYEVHSSWSLHVQSWTTQPGPWVHVVRYEDMLRDPRKAFGKVAGFLGLKPPPARIDRAIKRSSFETLRKQESEKGFRETSPKATRFFRVGKAGQWRDSLTEPQIEAIVAVHKEQMQRFGYWPL
jgi:hypothetical protein